MWGGATTKTAEGKGEGAGTATIEGCGATMKTAEGKGEGAGTATIEGLPDEILLKILSLLFGMTVMIYVPQVSKRWRKLCPQIKNVHLDFSWWDGSGWNARGWFQRGKKVPLAVLAGWFRQQQLQAVDDGGSGGGGSAAAAGRGGG